MENTRTVNLREANASKNVQKTLDDIIHRANEEGMNSSPYFAIAYQSMKCELMSIEKARKKRSRKAAMQC